MTTTDIKGFPLSDNWTLETADHATVFVQYRGIDVVAIWTPFDDPTPTANITVPSVQQLLDMVNEAKEDRAPYTEWARSDEIEINLAKHCQTIDLLDETIKRFNEQEQEFPVETWQAEVAAGKTQHGYRQWVDNQVYNKPSVLH